MRFPTPAKNGFENSWYYADPAQDKIPVRQSLSGPAEAEICIIGGGLAGLCTALSLAERGRSVIIIEKNRIGWGASGRNGGMVSVGFSAFYDSIIRKVGIEHTRSLYTMVNESMSLIRKRIRDYKIDTPVVDGVLETSWFDDADERREYVDILNKHCNTRAEYWSHKKVREHYSTDRYHDATFVPDGFHINPLRYLAGMARTVEAKNGRIFENTEVSEIIRLGGGNHFMIKTPGGHVVARKVVIACGAYISKDVNEDVAASNIPIRGYLMVTEPVAKKTMEKAIRAPYAVYDNRHVCSFFRPLADNRIMWGAKAGFFKDPADLENVLVDDMVSIFPQLEGVRAEKVWSGLMGYSSHGMPQIGEIEPGLWYNAGHGCHGLSVTALTGELIGRAIAENDISHRALGAFGLTNTGGTLGKIGAMLVYSSFIVRDKLAV
ncbi:MAG TPA: FAD-dependent oxidoreductase [Alphaproteobacteria bacterium]|jgi:gamma-glutamylputrescine oxidase